MIEFVDMSNIHKLKEIERCSECGCLSCNYCIKSGRVLCNPCQAIEDMLHGKKAEDAKKGK